MSNPEQMISGRQSVSRLWSSMDFRPGRKGVTWWLSAVFPTGVGPSRRNSSSSLWSGYRSASQVVRERRSFHRVWLAGLIMAWSACCGCHGKTGSADSKSTAHRAHQSVLRTPLVQVQRRVWPHVVRAQGSLVADDFSQIGATVAGRVAAVHKDLGEAVEEGEPLVTLDEQEFRLDVRRAEAQLLEARAAVGLPPDMPVEMLDPEKSPPVREAKTVWDEARLRLERAQRLRDAMAISEEEFEQAAAAEQVAAARYASALNSANERIAQIRVRAAEHDLAKRRLTEAVTRAPFRGFVQERFVAPGTYVQVGQPLMTLVRTDRLRFRGTLPERYAHQLRVGQRVVITVEGFADPVEAHVSRMSPSIDELTRSLLFEAMLDNADQKFRSGLFAVAEVYLDAETTALVVPASAIFEFAGTEKVWLVADGWAKEQPVTTGRRRDRWVEILEGVQEGDWLIANGAQGRAARVEPLTPSGPVAADTSAPTPPEAPGDDPAPSSQTGGG